MKNLLNYIIENSEDLNYVVSSETFYDNQEFNSKDLKISDINKFANYLNNNLTSNEKIGLLMENCNSFVKAFYAILLNNKIVVSINDKVEMVELNDIISKNNLDLIITNNTNINRINVSSKINIINIDTINNEEETKLLFTPKEKKMEDILVISYTSGTSGSFSKGVELTYKNITFVSEEYQKVYHLDDSSKIIAVLPFWHNYAMFACLTSSIVSKSSLIIMKEWDANLFIDINKLIKPSVFPGSPYMYIDLINNHQDELTELTNLRICDSGGDSLPIECIKKFEDLTGAIITEGYGLTETASLTHFNYSASERKVGSLGKAVSKTECKILDLEGNELSIDEWGLLWIKGPMVFKDYVKLPGLKDKVKKEEWFNTGDVVKCDNDGYYYIAGRFSDLKNINADDNQLRNLENALYKFDGISRVHIKTNYNNIASFYYFDIFAILKENYSLQDLYDYINLNLKQYVIGDVRIVDVLPTTGTGKIKRNKINDLLTMDFEKYDKKELSGGLRCKTYLIENSKKEKFIYQEYYQNTKYQAKKKYNILNMILQNTECNYISKALSYGEDKDKTWLLTEYKSGKTLEKMRNNKKFSLSVIAKDIASTLYKIHSIKSDEYGWITDNEVLSYKTFVNYLESELERFKSAVNDSISKEDLSFILLKAKESLEVIKNYEEKFHPQLIWFDLNSNNILINDDQDKFQLSAIIDAGGAKYGIKEWDLAFIKMESCLNVQEYEAIFNEYKKLDSTLNEELVKALCVFIEIDDMIIRFLDKVNLAIPYDTVFYDIINKYSIK